MAGPWEKYAAQPQGIKLRGNDPKLPGQVRGQDLSNAKARIDIDNAPIERTGKMLGNERTQQEIVESRRKEGLALAEQFEKLPAVRDYREVLPQVASAMGAPDNAQGDLAVIYAFAKVMDPGSAVREGEMALAQSTSPLLGQLQSYIGMVNNGKRLPAQTRVGLIEAMREKGRQFDAAYSTARNQYAGFARQGGFKPDQILGPHAGLQFQQVEKNYIARHNKDGQTGSALEPATGPTRKSIDKEKSSALDAMIRSGVSFRHANDFAMMGGGSALDPKMYAQAVAYAKAHPNTPGSFAEATITTPTTAGQRMRSEIDKAVGPGIIPGAVKGVTHAWDRAATLAESGINRVTGMGLDDAAAAAQRHNDFFSTIPTDPTAETIGKIGGAGFFAAPFGGPITQGALGNVLAADSTDTTGIVTDAVVGGIGGKVGDMVLRSIAGVVAPGSGYAPRDLATLEAARRLNAEGVKLRPGRFIPGVSKTEDLLSSYPMVGSRIDDLARQEIETLNRVPANRALGRVGQTLPADVPAGHQAVNHTGRTLGDLYDSTLQGATANIDPTFVTRMNYLGQRSGLRPQEFDELNGIIQREIGGAWQNGKGSISGRNFKRLDSKLGSMASKFKASPDDPYKIQLGDSIEFVQEQMRHLFRRQNPSRASDLRNIDNAWADFVPYQRAAAMDVAEGLASPGQMRSAVRQNDRSLRKGMVARGEARMQDLASDASNVIPSSRGNSGTADRENLSRPTAWALGAAAKPFYSQPAFDFYEKLMLRSPGLASQLAANTLRSGLIPRGSLGAALPTIWDQ